MRDVLLHGGVDEASDRSVAFARCLTRSFGARLHVLCTLGHPLSLDSAHCAVLVLR